MDVFVGSRHGKDVMCGDFGARIDAVTSMVPGGRWASRLIASGACSRTMHDSVSQALYGIALGAHTAQDMTDADSELDELLDYILSLSEAGLTEMRSLIFELRPESLATEGLVAALAKRVDVLRVRHHLIVEADLGVEPEVELSLKETPYRIAQEAFHNTVKHARATSPHTVGLLRSPAGAERGPSFAHTCPATAHDRSYGSWVTTGALDEAQALPLCRIAQPGDRLGNDARSHGALTSSPPASPTKRGESHVRLECSGS